MFPALVIAAALMGSSPSAMAAPTVPFSDYFGDTTTTCDAAWDGDCEVGWSGHGEDDSLKLVEQATSGNYAVRITPGSTMPNGISQEFEVDDDEDRLAASFLAWTHDGSATVYTRAVFKNSGGTAISTQTRSTSVSCPSSEHELVHAVFNIPTNAVSATVFIGAANGSGSDPDVEIVTTNASNIPIYLLYLLSDSPGTCPDVDCEDISCDVGESPVCICDPGVWPGCDATNECWCEENVEVCDWEG